MENWVYEINCEVFERDRAYLDREVQEFGRSVANVLSEDSTFVRIEMEKIDGVIIVKKFYTKTIIDTD